MLYVLVGELACGVRGLLEGLYGDFKGRRRDHPKVNPSGRTDTNLYRLSTRNRTAARNVRLRNNWDAVGDVMRDFTRPAAMHGI